MKDRQDIDTVIPCIGSFLDKATAYMDEVKLTKGSLLYSIPSVEINGRCWKSCGKLTKWIVSFKRFVNKWR